MGYRSPILTALVVGAAILIIATIHQVHQRAPQIKSMLGYTDEPPEPTLAPPVELPETFYDIGMAYGTDKVSDHPGGRKYHRMYDKDLPAFRNRRVKMLEIGLGCTMDYGPGASYFAWLQYFPDVELYFIESDEACARDWADAMSDATIVVGDQADIGFLEDFVATYGRDFDIIIDDGGHTPTQQLNSLEHLWKAIRPGGIYFIEDLEFNYSDDWGGGNTAIAQGYHTTIQVINQMIEDLMTAAAGILPRRVVFDDVESVAQIDCMQFMCSIWKEEK